MVGSSTSHQIQGRSAEGGSRWVRCHCPPCSRASGTGDDSPVLCGRLWVHWPEQLWFRFPIHEVNLPRAWGGSLRPSPANLTMTAHSGTPASPALLCSSLPGLLTAIHAQQPLCLLFPLPRMLFPPQLPTGLTPWHSFRSQLS